jgi:hypothetical protein
MYSETHNCYLSEMGAADYKRLHKQGWLDGGIGVGFANTTHLFDSQTLIGTSKVLIECDKGYLYTVAYYSGCFYPIWERVCTKGRETPKFNRKYKLKGGKAISVKPY